MCVSSTVTVRRSGVFTCINNDGMSVPDPDTLSGPTSLIWMLLLLGDFLTYDSCSPSLNAPTWTLSKFPNTSLINLMWMREVCTQELLLYSNTVLCSSQDFKNYCVASSFLDMEKTIHGFVSSHLDYFSSLFHQ